MANGKSGSFGSRKGIKTPPVMVQGNQLRVAKDPAPWFADFDSLAAQCTALTTSPAAILPYFSDEVLMSKIDRHGVNEAVKALTEQVAQQKDRLAALVAETKAMREGVPATDTTPAREPITKVTQDNTVELLNHGEQFQTFMDDWLRIIFFSTDKVLQFFRDLGEEIPVLCPYSQGYVKTEGTMSPEELKAATNVSLDELATEVAEEDSLGQMIVGVLQASPLKSKHRKGFMALLQITGKEFDKLVAGDYSQFGLAKLKFIFEKMELKEFTEELVAAEQAELQQMEEAARGLDSGARIGVVDESTYLQKSE